MISTCKAICQCGKLEAWKKKENETLPTQTEEMGRSSPLFTKICIFFSCQKTLRYESGTWSKMHFFLPTFCACDSAGFKAKVQEFFVTSFLCIGPLSSFLEPRECNLPL